VALVPENYTPIHGLIYVDFMSSPYLTSGLPQEKRMRFEGMNIGCRGSWDGVKKWGNSAVKGGMMCVKHGHEAEDLTSWNGGFNDVIYVQTQTMEMG